MEIYIYIYMEICGNSGDICWKYMHIYPVISWHTLNNYKLLNPLGTRNASDASIWRRLSHRPTSSVLAIRSQWWMVFPLQMTLTPGCNPWLFPLVTRTVPPNMVDVSSKEIGFKWCIWMYMVYIYAVYCRNTYVNT